MNVESPNHALEKRLRQAIMSSLHDLVPEFHSHVGHCAACNGFHEWLLWEHRAGTNEWTAQCPSSGATLRLPFSLGQK